MKALSAAALVWIAMTCIAGPLAAKEWPAGNYAFSDELGGFRLISVTGTGTSRDPVILVEEVTSILPVTLVIRRKGLTPESRFGTAATSSSLVIKKLAINRSGRAWVGFDMELQEVYEQPSPYGDGLSFDQMNTFSSSIRSDRFAKMRRRFEPHDRIRFSDGVVDPGGSVRFDIYITDPTPIAQFYLVQDPSVPFARLAPVPLRNFSVLKDENGG